MNTYQLAFVGPGNETWDIVEQFQAEYDDAENAWVQANECRIGKQYDNDEWYVLDADGKNING